MNRIPIIFGLLAACLTVAPVAEARNFKLSATERMPNAEGKAETTLVGTTTQVELSFNDMKPAALFGGDFNTYVVWVVFGGQAHNMGEVSLDGDSQSLTLTTPANAPADGFELFVTAEPHSLVDTPSRFAVLRTKGLDDTMYVLNETQYYHERSSLDDVHEADKPLRTEVQQAYTALRLAARAQAHVSHAEEYDTAYRSLQKTLELARHESAEIVASQARETIRLATGIGRVANLND